MESIIFNSNKKYQYRYKRKKTNCFVTKTGEVYKYENGKYKIINPSVTNNGYLTVSVKTRKKSTSMFVHRMIAQTFIPNIKNKPEVNHIDGNKKNNFVTNLEWVTRKENAEHAYRTGLFGFGEDMGTSSITNETCRKICSLLENTNLGPKAISKKVNCSSKIVNDILHKKTLLFISNDYDFSHRKLRKNISDDKVKQIINLLILGNNSSREIADIVGCKVHVVKDIRRGRTHKSEYYDRYVIK